MASTNAHGEAALVAELNAHGEAAHECPANTNDEVTLVAKLNHAAERHMNAWLCGEATFE